jgi:hypothetical protein
MRSSCIRQGLWCARYERLSVTIWGECLHVLILLFTANPRSVNLTVPYSLKSPIVKFWRCLPACVEGIFMYLVSLTLILIPILPAVNKQHYSARIA